MRGGRKASRILAAIGAIALLVVEAGAQETGRWKLALGRGTASATLYSLNTLTAGTRTIDYRPALVISCDADRANVWRQSVQIRQAISGDGQTTVGVRFDGGSSNETWTLADKSRSLQADGGERLARLARARRMSLSWRFGVFSGRGEAVFDVTGIKETVARMAEACGTSAP